MLAKARQTDDNLHCGSLTRYLFSLDHWSKVVLEAYIEPVSLLLHWVSYMQVDIGLASCM